MNPASNALLQAEQSANPFNLIPFVRPADESGGALPETKRRVLIIASDGAVRGGVDRLLKADFKVKLEPSADAGLTAAGLETFALVVLDLRGMTGEVQVVKEKLRAIDEDVSLLILTAGNKARVVDHQCVHAPFDAPDMRDQAVRLADLSERRRGRSVSLKQMEGVIALLQEELVAKESIANYGEASASMVHDLRNALFSTLGYTARLIQETTQLKNDLPDKMGPIDQIAHKLEHTSNYLFHLSQTCRYNDGAKTRRERFDLTEEVRHVHRVLFFSSPNLMVTGSSAEILADRFELHRVLQNLFKNAFESGAEQVSAILSKEVDRVILRVIDNGRGFSIEDAAVVFQRPLASSKRGGQGLGLRICRQIIERLGGTITLSSKPGEGAEFEISLPSAG